MTRYLLLLLALVTTASCTEQLVTPGECPVLCPGGLPEVRDTVLTAVVGGDSAFTDYASRVNAATLMVSNGGTFGDTRALIRFLPRGDSVFAGDSLKPFTIDSVLLSVVLQERDTLVTNLSLDLYRLPASFDSLTTFEELDAGMTPAALLGTLEIADAARSGRLTLLFTGDDLERLEFSPRDSTRLVIGVRLRAPVPTGVYLGGLLGGDGTPLYQTFTDVEIADTLLQKPLLQRGVAQNLTLFGERPPVAPDLLAVGGPDASRALIRFPFPAYLRDSATIIRATLELIPDGEVYGIAGDSTRLDVRTVVADFGAKSVVNPNTIASGWIYPGSDTSRVEMANLVAQWQSSPQYPTAVRVQGGQEFGSFLAPRYRSTRISSASPRLRITYRLPYGTTGF